MMEGPDTGPQELPDSWSLDGRMLEFYLPQEGVTLEGAALGDIMTNFDQLYGALSAITHSEDPVTRFVVKLDAELRRVVAVLDAQFDTIILRRLDLYHLLLRCQTPGALSSSSSPEASSPPMRKIYKKILQQLEEGSTLIENVNGAIDTNRCQLGKLAAQLKESPTADGAAERRASAAKWVECHGTSMLDFAALNECSLVLTSMCHHLLRQVCGFSSSHSLSAVLDHSDSDPSEANFSSVQSGSVLPRSEAKQAELLSTVNESYSVPLGGAMKPPADLPEREYEEFTSDDQGAEFLSDEQPCSVPASTKTQPRCTRRILVRQKDEVKMRLNLVKHLAIINFSVELKVLRYSKGVMKLFQLERCIPNDDLTLRYFLSGDDEFLSLLRSKGMQPSKSFTQLPSADADNVHMCFFDSSELHGYRDLVLDTNLKRNRGRERRLNFHDEEQTVEEGGVDEIGKARLWRLRWGAQRWSKDPRALLLERIDYKNADGKTTMRKGYYADVPGGTFRDPAMPIGYMENRDIPTPHEVWEEGVFGVVLEMSELTALLVKQSKFDIEHCSEYHADRDNLPKDGAADTRECIRLHYVKVLQAFRNSITKYNIKPVLQFWCTRSMFVFTDPLKETFISSLPAFKCLNLENRTAWSHAANVASSTVVLCDKNIAYVNQYDLHFHYDPLDVKDNASYKRPPRPLLSGEAAQSAVWPFQRIVVRIHGRQERVHRISSLMNRLCAKSVEVDGFSSFVHGTSTLIAEKFNAPRLERGDSITTIPMPEWMNFSELVKSAERNYHQQRKRKGEKIRPAASNSVTKEEAFKVTTPPAVSRTSAGEQHDLFNVKDSVFLTKHEETVWQNDVSCTDEINTDSRHRLPEPYSLVSPLLGSRVLGAGNDAKVTAGTYLRRLWQSVGPGELAMSSAESKIKGAAVVRVEPKAFFANERTLLQWMNICVLLSTLGIGLLSLHGGTSQLGGAVIGTTAVIFLWWSYLLYKQRNTALIAREPINYSNESAPFFLAVALTAAISITMASSIIGALQSDFSSQVAVPRAM